MIMEKFNRAERRFQIERLKQTRKGYYRGSCDTAKALGKVIQYPAWCSCPMCGNARKWFGERTIQEQRWLQREKAGVV